mgnify:FL=1
MAEQQSFFKRRRDDLQQLIYVIINPVVSGLVKIGFTPNMVTTVGFLGNIAAACLFIAAAVKCQQDATAQVDANLVLWGGIVLIISSLFDMLDGQVARKGNMVSTFGAMYDSVLDRYSELVTLGGIAYLLVLSGDLTGSIITFVALVGSLMVSYVRARAEGLGIECKIGLMQRPERVVITSVAAIVAGATNCMMVLVVAMGIIAVFANITAFARIFYSKRQLQKK